jgi:hypothetical protein
VVPAGFDEATNAWRASAKLAIASRTTISSTFRDSPASMLSSAFVSGRRDARPVRRARRPRRAARRRCPRSAPSSAARSPLTSACIASRCCCTTLRATPRPSMPSVSATRPSASTCGCRPRTSVGRCADAGRARP